jgi:hypothetical protein
MKWTLKSLAVAAAFVVGFAGASLAGEGHKGAMSPERVKERVARMKADLALTDDQAARIEQILNESTAQAEAIRKTQPAEGASKAESQASWDQLRQNHKQAKENVRAVLTEEQRVKWDQLEKERHTRYKNKSKDGSN